MVRYIDFTTINVEVGIIYYYKITAVDKENWESHPSSIVSDRILPPGEIWYTEVNKKNYGDPVFRIKPAYQRQHLLLACRSGFENGD